MSSPIVAAGDEVDENEPLIRRVKQGLDRYENDSFEYFFRMLDLAGDKETSLKTKAPAVRQITLALNEWLKWFYQAQESLLRAKAGASVDGEEVMEELREIVTDAEKMISDLKEVEGEMIL